MKGFERNNSYLSLCGLNCGLCPMHLGKYCGGCGVDNQSCTIARCSLEHGKIEYCSECTYYPCDKYQHIEEFDSFITHKRQKTDLEKAKRIGIDAYNCEQKEKMKILDCLLSDYNDGRRKTFFCVAVNLLELSELQEVMRQIECNNDLPFVDVKERSKIVVELFQKVAEKRNVTLKLRKKK